MNPLMTPVLAITGPDEVCPLFHFWCHHLWPKLASRKLKFCRMEKAFPVIPRSEWLGELSLRYVQIMFRNWSEKSSKISLSYTWLVWGKNFVFSEILELEAQKKVNNCSKRIRKWEKGKVKKQNKRPKT